MKIQVVDCNDLFIKPLIEEIKNNINAYHQGFMVVAGTLYLPYYSVLRHHYSLPDNAETTVIDLDDVIACDDLATHFNSFTVLDIDDIIDMHFAWLDNDFSNLLNVVDEIAQSKYDLGFNDGYDVGNIDGWCECSDSME